ncbi:hypothetical protein IC582_028850 [Cucumis melo]
MHHVWSCMYLSGLKVIKSQVFESQMARIQEIDPTDDEHAYLDQSVEIPTTEGYVEDPPAPISHHVERSLTPPHVKHPLPLLLSNSPVLLLTTTVVPPHLRSSLLSSLLLSLIDPM